MARALLLRAEDDLDGAVTELERASSLYLPGFFPDVRPIHAVIARIRIAEGRLGEAWDWAHEHRVAATDELSYLAEFGHLTLARLLIAQHRSDDDPACVEDALALLDRLLAGAHQAGRGGTVIDVHVLRALAHDARGERQQALTQLEHAVGEGVPNGYVRLFLDEGAPMQELLRAAEARPAGRELVREVLGTGARAAGRATVRSAATPLLDGLSEREVEVLRLLATSLSGPEIARQLFMSINTFRTHSRHIFTKLNVKTRRAAVLRAAELGLV